MRRVAMGLVAMLAAGCAAPATQLFDLSPRGLEAVPADGSASVRVEATTVTFVATFAGMWADLIVFDIEVTNHSDSTMVLDPAAFSYTLSSVRGRRANVPRRPVPALVPEQAVAAIDRWLQAEERSHAAKVGFQTFFDLVDLAVYAFASYELGPEETYEHGQANLARWEARSLASDEFHEHSWQQRMRRYEAKARMLHRAKLRPGRSATGSLFLPASHLRLALGPDENSASITAPVSRAAADFRLTLHAPGALGAPPIEYAIRRVRQE